MPRKEAILEVALRLFNETNTQSATTNHIAKAMGISPGNLHYHYKNREEIIRLLYKKLVEEMSLSIAELPKTLNKLQEHEKVLIEVQWKYRFFFKEILFLFSRDKELEKMYVEDNIAHKGRITQVIQNLHKNKELSIPNDEVLEFLVNSVLLSWQFYNSHLHTLGEEIDTCSSHKVIAYTQIAMQPYIVKKEA